MEKILADGPRIWFLALYAIGIVFILIKFIPVQRRQQVFENRIVDSRRLLPMICLPVDWLVPPLIVLSGIGQVPAIWSLVRVLGFVLSIYAFGILVWVPKALGRFLIPEAAVFSDHVLVTSGPFHFLRHPSFSGALALWLGTALGTLNWLLFVLWFSLVIGKTIQARAEEEILHTKFGSVYEEYSRKTGRFIPKVW